MSETSKPQVTKTSICNCQQVQISVTGVDKGSVLCHCSNCQKSSGSAFGHNHRFSPGELEIIDGENLIKQYADSSTKSGNTLNRHFCGNCGSSLYLTSSAVKDLVILHGGCIEGGSTQPKFEVFPENKYSWVGNLTSSGKL